MHLRHMGMASGLGCNLPVVITIGGIMQYKPAAGIFVGGVTMSIFGSLLGSASGFFASMAFARGDQAMVSVFLVVAGLGGILALIGLIMLIVATHRAFVKIDALPTGAAARQREHWPSDR